MVVCLDTHNNKGNGGLMVPNEYEIRFMENKTLWIDMFILSGKESGD